MSQKIKINETCTNEEKAGTPENRMESPLDLLQERLAVLWEEVKEAGKIAKHGEILDDMETALMVGSRALLREFMEKAVALFHACSSTGSSARAFTVWMPCKDSTSRLCRRPSA